MLEFAGAAGAVFLALVLTWMAADTLLRIDELSEGSASAGWQIFLRALDVVPLAVSISALAGAVWSVTRAVRFREVTAIRCGGIPLRSVLFPMLGLSLAAGGLLILFEDRVIVPGRQALHLAESGRSGQDSGHPPTFLNGRWWYASGSSIFSAGSYVPATQSLHDVTVFEFDDQRRIRRRIDAEIAVNTSLQTWEFRTVQMREFSPGSTLREQQLPVLKLDLGLSVAEIGRAQPPAARTTLHRLARRLRNSTGTETGLTSLAVGFHARLAQPLSVLVLVLLALPFAVGDIERTDSLPRALLRSLAAAGIYWTGWSLALVAGRSGMMPPAFPVWGLTLLALTIGAWRFRQIKE